MRILDFLKTLAKRRAVFVLDALLVGGNSVTITVSTVQGSALSRVALSPRWAESDALEDEQGTL